jgi:hypothetical protein
VVTTIHAGRAGRRLALLLGAAGLAAAGCQSAPVDVSQGPAPLRTPPPGAAPRSFEEGLTGGQVFAMYCNQCHNAKTLAERPFATYQNAAAHMRVRANLTGEEYAKLLEFMRRWHDVPPPPDPASEPSPKRLIFAQPVAELRPEPGAAGDGRANPARPAAPAEGEPDPAAGPEPLPGRADAAPSEPAGPNYWTAGGQ